MIPAIPLRLYAYGAVALAFVGVLTFAGCAHRNANHARAERDVANQSKDLALTANESNLETIRIQDEALNKWVKLGVTPDEVRAMLSQAGAQAKELETLRMKFRALKESDRALPECVQLLGISLTQRCPDISAGLRDAADRGENRAGRNTGSGSESAAR